MPKARLHVSGGAAHPAVVGRVGGFEEALKAVANARWGEDYILDSLKKTEIFFFIKFSHHFFFPIGTKIEQLNAEEKHITLKGSLFCITIT